MGYETLIIIVVSILVGISGQLAYLFVVDHEMMRTSKGRIKELQQQMKLIKPNDPNFKPLYKEIMAENSKLMKEQFKPTFITFIPFLVVFFIMSYLFNYAPVAVGVPVQMSISGHVNGTLSSAASCVSFNKSSSISLFSNDSSINTPVSFSGSGPCQLILSQNKVNYNTTLSGIIGATSIKSFKIDNVSLKVTPNIYIVTGMPFSIPLIGNKLNWFWTYFIVTFISSIALNRVFAHYKLIA
ncbi:MAG: EMC3/TMCO1 family protein [Candidatus Parvarchaeota archaeon]|jgi:hypothetical protein|nr:EMC3/TMCO1 family protein [Candidatus Parvarchaeota archaeon]MCL5017807.1 EMC3/TMCO1 family protein [Candidatus Parvarchaeota archaeon]